MPDRTKSSAISCRKWCSGSKPAPFRERADQEARHLYEEDTWQNASARKPGFWTKLAYGSGAAANGIKNNGFEYFLLFYYSQVLGVDFALVGAALMIAMFVDGFTDPLVGYWSDNIKTRFGRGIPSCILRHCRSV